LNSLKYYVTILLLKRNKSNLFPTSENPFQLCEAPRPPKRHCAKRKTAKTALFSNCAKRKIRKMALCETKNGKKRLFRQLCEISETQKIHENSTAF
jgi:hypothetical protein